MSIAEVWRARSRCERGEGAVIVDQFNQVRASGYTGPPAKWRPGRDSSIDDCRAYCERASKTAPEERSVNYLDCPSSHAEQNALAKVNPDNIVNGTFYISAVPCVACAKAIANSGISTVVWRKWPKLESGRNVNWVVDYFEECGIDVVVMEVLE